MSNLIQQLQEGLKINNKLYEEIKNEEIINLIIHYKKNPEKYSTYEKYFNRKCVEDYKIFLLSNINHEIEKILIKDNLNEILEMKIKLLLKKYKNNIRMLLKQFKVNNKDLIKNLRETNNLMKKIEMKKELNKSYNEEEEKYNMINNNIDNIIEEEIKKYLSTNEKSELLEDYINYLIRINKRLVNMRINEKEYNNYLMRKFTEGDYDNVEELINDNVTKDYINSSNLSLMIIKYNNIKGQTLGELINYLPEEIDREYVNKYKELNLEDLKDVEDINTSIKNHLLIEIIEVCEQPLNENYLKYLEEVYRLNKMDNLYENIVEQNKEIKEMLIEYEEEELLFAKKIIEKIKKNDEYEIDILKKSFMEDMNDKEYEMLLSEYNMIRDIIKNEDESYEILDFYVTTKMSNILIDLRDFNLTTNIKDLKKNLKLNNYDDMDINTELQKYEIERKKNKNYIYVSTNDVFQNNNILTLFRFYMNLEKKIKLLNNVELIENMNKIIQITLSQVFEHYIKSIDYKNLNDTDDNRLYYNLNDDENIRVYVKDPIMRILDYLKRNNNDDKEENEYIYEKILEHIFNYEYYNLKLESRQNIIEKISDNVMMNNYNNILQILNDIYKNKKYENDIKEMDKKINDYMNKIMNIRFEENKSRNKYFKLININNEFNILTNEEMNYLKSKWDDYQEFMYLKVSNKTTEKEMIGLLKFMKLLLGEMKEITKEKNIKLFNNNKTEKEEKVEKEMIKELRRLMNEEIKSLKNDKVKANKVYLMNNIDLDKVIEDNDITYLTIDTFQKLYNNEKKTKDSIIVESIINTLKMLENIYNIKYENINELQTDMINEKNKLIVISRKNTKDIDYKNIYKRLNMENKNLYDLVKYITILYYMDYLIHKEVDVYNKMNINNKEKEGSLKNKKIFIIKNISNEKNIKEKIDEIIKEEGDIYYTNTEKLSRNDFILLDTLKDKTVKILNGQYKGRYGRLMKVKEMKFITKEVRKNMDLERKYLNDIIKKFNNKIIKINSVKLNEIVDEIELSELEKYRKTLYIGKYNLDEKYFYNIKINPRINKILNNYEDVFIKKYRRDRLNELEYQKNIYEQEIKGMKKDIPKFIVKVNEGQKNEKNIYLKTDEVKFNTEMIMNEELLETVKKIIDNKKIEFNNLYDLTKYLFNYSNVSIEDNLEYFINIYKDSLEIYNYNKMNHMNKLDIVSRLEESIRKLKKNQIILEKKNKKKTLKDDEVKYLEKIKKLLKTKNNQYEKYKKDIKKLEIFNDKTINGYDNEIVKRNNFYYFVENNKLLNNDIKEIKDMNMKKLKDDKILEEELMIKMNMLVNELKDYLNNIINKEEKGKIKLIEYLRDNYISEDEEDEEEEYNIDDILDELDVIEDDEPKKPKTWLELDDEDFSDSGLSLN